MKTRAQFLSGKASKRPWRALIFAILLGLFAGLSQIAEPLELALKVARSKLRDDPASGSVVLVAIDDRSIAEFGAAPWNGARLADLTRRVHQAGVRSIHIDTDLPTDGQAAGAGALIAAMRGAGGKVSLPARFSHHPVTEARIEHLPHPDFARHARLVNTNLRVWWDWSVWHHPYALTVGDRVLPSLAASLSGVQGSSGEMFPINHNIDIRSLAVVSASDLMTGRVSAGELTGRDVIIARTDVGVEFYRAPGTRTAPGIMFHMLAAETLRLGRPVDVGWLPPLLVAALAAAGILVMRRRFVAGALISGALGTALIGPVILEHAQMFVEILPGIIVILTATTARTVNSVRRSFDKRGTTNLITGMPNLQALRQVPAPQGAAVVVARIKNYAQISSTLASQHEKELVEQIVARLSFGTAGSLIYQADDGVFVWVARDRQEDSVTQQLEALHALFRSPVVVATRLIDLAISFGIDLDATRPLLQRVPSALVAAEEAGREGKRWASFNAENLEDAEWAMSLLARLDHAINTGELWVAYQPKLDCLTGEITGAEALVRWTHPEKGQIYPDQFIAAAEEGGRIERLTYFVLDRALETVALISSEDGRFGVAVNLSATLLSDDRLVGEVDALLRRYKVAPELLTLEVTETSTMGSAADALVNLERLAALGVELSIDDYGTGFSTLEYLKRIPASELKIDRSFISMLHKSQSDRIMVNSTIQLAHSLGRKVVAEGVENEEIFSELRRMRCDIVQGYHIGRPMPLPQLLDLLSQNRSGRRAA